MTMADLRISQATFENCFKHYEGLPHQKAAVAKLYKHILEADPSLVTEQAEWLRDFRNRAGELLGRTLTVPYFSQRDNKSGTGYRECFSSSIAMICAYLVPDKIKSDDQWNSLRAKYGDTTDVQAQLQALRSIGLKANFLTNGTGSKIKEEIRQGRPVAVGWLHKGPVSAPSGSGHWSVVIGFTADGRFIHNDPYGEAALIEGGYVNSKGAGVKYSEKNWLPRWEVDGKGSGWFVTVSR
jgi:hypothetical protein